jgi:MFS family permease
MEGPSPGDFGLTADQVERIEARHDLICRRLVSVPFLVALLASWVGFLVVCSDCSTLLALLLALGLLAVFMTLLGLVSTILVFAVYPVIARWLSPRYRAVSRFRAAQEQYEALPPLQRGEGA